MGDAKRRRELGTMTQTHPFTATATRQGDFTLERAPTDRRLRGSLEAALAQHLPRGAAFDALARSAAALDPRATGAEEVTVSGELLTRWVFAAHPDPAERARALREALPVGGEGEDTALRLREWRWNGRAVPDPRSRGVARTLGAHPQAAELGAARGVYLAEVSRHGRVVLDPDPEDDALEPLEAVAARLCGGTSGWERAHAAARQGAGETALGAPPETRRLVLEVRALPPLLWEGNAPLAFVGEDGVYLQPGTESFEGEGGEYVAYGGGENATSLGLTEESLGDILAEMFDVPTYTATVTREGEVQLTGEGAPGGEAAEAAILALRQAYGAGTPAWGQRARAALGSYWEAPEGAALPEPEALRVEVPADLEAGDDLQGGGLLMEAEVRLGGVWHDLYDAPPEGLWPEQGQEEP